MSPRRALMPFVCLVLCMGLGASAQSGVALGADALSDPGAGLGKALGHGQVITGATTHRLLHFTFDDGPDERTTPALLDKLDRARVKATFFFSASRFGSKARRHDGSHELAQEVLRRGHGVGSHSVDHQRMGRLSPAALRQQLDLSEAHFQSVFGQRTFLFRPPFGSRNAHLDRMLQERGYTTVMWNVGLADWVRRPPEAILETWGKVLKRNQQREGQRGGVVLMHDTHQWTVDAFDLIMADIGRRNCELLARDEELFDVVPTLKPFYLPADGKPDPQLEDWIRSRQAALKQREQARCSGS